MVSKNNRKLIADKNRRNEKQRFGLRKLNVGVASVLLGVTFSLYGGGQIVAHADTTPKANGNGSDEAKTTSQDSLADQKQFVLKSTDQQNTQANTTTGESAQSQSAQASQTVAEQQAEKKVNDSVVQPANEKQSAEQTVTKQTKEQNFNEVRLRTKAITNSNNQASQATKESQTSDQTTDKNTEQSVVKTDSSEKTKTNAQNTTTLNLTKSSDRQANTVTTDKTLAASLVAKANDATDTDTVTVTTAQKLIDAIQKGKYTTINIASNIDLGEKTSSLYTSTPISNKRNITIQSADGQRYTVDFNGYGFNMYSNDYGVTFKNLDLYGRSYFGIFRSAGSYTFDNVNYTGSQLIYTDSGYDTTVNFDGNVTAKSVGSYVSPLNNKNQTSQGGNTQQVIQFTAGTNTINFNSGSNVNLTTTNSNVLEVDAGTTTINVKNDAQVTLNPHTQNGPEQLHGMNMDGIARGIASNGTTTLNVDKGGTLNIDLKNNPEDKYHSSALYLNSGATINAMGNLNINSDGEPYYRSQGTDDPVYINGSAAINVNGGSFKINATNMGNHKGSIITSNGSSTIAIKHQGTFEVTGDGTKANAVQLGSGSTFTSDQPGLFEISMPEGATAIKGGKVQFSRVKTSESGQPIGEIDITYASDGTPTVTKVTSHDRQTVIDTKKADDEAKNKINLIAAGENVDLSNAVLTKDADGNYTMSGTATPGSYITINLDGNTLPSSGSTGDHSQTVYTITNSSDEPTTITVPYTVQAGTDGKWTVDLGRLGESGTLSAQASKDFVESNTESKTIEEWLKESGDTLNQAKDKANTAIDKAAQDKKDEIAKSLQDGNIDQTKADALNQKVDDEVTAAKKAVDEATSPKGVTQAQTEGVNKIKDIKVPGAKDKANTAIDKAANKAKDNIDQNSDLTSDQKKAAKKNIDDDVNAAKDAIKNAKNDQEVTDAKNNGLTDIAKEEAKAAIDNELAKKDKEISNSSLTNEEKDAKKQEAKAAADNAITDINNAKDVAGVNAAKNTGITNIDNVKVPETSPVKDQANQAIDDALAAKNKQIDDATNLSDSEKQALKDQAKKIADDAKAAIKNAKDSAEVNKTRDQAVNDIANVPVPSLDDTKKQANDMVDKALAKKTDQINDIDTLSPTDKANLIQKATDEANKAKDNINKANTNDEVKTAEDNGIKAIENIKIPGLNDVKKNAVEAIDQVAAAKKKQIDEATNLTDPEKAALKNQVDDLANKAKDNIEKANTNKVANNARDKGISAITGVNIPSLDSAKADAKQAIADALKSKNSEIEAATNLSDSQKTDLKKQAQAAADSANKAIDEATTNDAAKSAADQGVADILGIKVPTLDEAKDNANQAIDQAAKDKKDAIKDAQAAGNITADQAKNLNNQVDQAANDAKDAIKAAQNDDAVKAAQKQGVDTINGIKVPTTPVTPTTPTLDETKDSANQAIDNAAAAKKDAIKAAQDAGNITADQAKDLNDQVDSAAKSAKDAIDAAQDTDAVKAAQEAGINKINGIKVPTTPATPSINDVKNAAKDAIDQAAKAKDAAIDASGLSDQEKADLKNEVKIIAQTAKENIDSVDSAAEVENAKNAGIAAINGIKVATSSDNQNEQSGNNGSDINNGSGVLTNNNGSQAGAATTQSNGAKISATSLNGQNAVRTNSKQAAQLPQTGNENNASLSAVGLAAASLAGLFGFAKLGKKKED